jgi:hypothetical protein
MDILQELQLLEHLREPDFQSSPEDSPLQAIASPSGRGQHRAQSVQLRMFLDLCNELQERTLEPESVESIFLHLSPSQPVRIQVQRQEARKAPRIYGPPTNRASKRSNTKVHISGLQRLEVRRYAIKEILGSILPVQSPRGEVFHLLETPEDL